MLNDIIVVELGSSVLRREVDVPTAVHEIYRWYRTGWRVVAVVSPIGETSEQLLREARELAPDPQAHATAELLATGERYAAALLGIALDRAGIPARVVDPREISLAAPGTVLDSAPSTVNTARLLVLLDEQPIVVMPRFFGFGADKRLHVLGRGGSDVSAVHLASALDANHCRLVKDEDGVYESDPAVAACTSLQRFSALGYADALEHAAPLIQPKAVRFLARHSRRAKVAAVASPYESVIGRFNRTLTGSAKPPRTCVLLLGLGTVGLGVYQRIAAMPEHFRVVGALVRDPRKYEAAGIARELIYESQDEVANLRADAVVDALPGLEPSHSLVQHFLSHGIDVVSANKILIAEAGPELTALAAQSDTYLLYSAVVGGSAPMLEALRREVHHDEIRRIAGILDGTCNYMLDRFAADRDFDEAIRDAHAAGFSETGPREDLSGQDTVRKLRILARHAFGQDLHALEVQPLSASTLKRSRMALRHGETLRLIARAWKIAHRVFGQVQLEVVATEDPFAQTREEWNRLVITRANGEDIVVCGRGTGRWPTTEAVMADLLDIRFARLAIARGTR